MLEGIPFCVTPSNSPFSRGELSDHFIMLDARSTSACILASDASRLARSEILSFAFEKSRNSGEFVIDWKKASKPVGFVGVGIVID